MGLQNQLNDVSSDSIPLLFIGLIANCVSHLRAFLFGLFKSLGLTRFDPDHVVDDGLLSAVGSGLAGLIVLSEQLNLNRLFSYRYDTVSGGDGGPHGSDCVVCLTTLRDGDQVRKLDCRHVFHKHCFDGWLGHHKFNCPLCRLPLVSEERVALTERRVGDDLVSWFSLR
ncbi:E3 ubiquitin-protein ligase RHA2A [Quillaja saponaria]|uniref:E3 ubiquitin-protein ligase RHA2A n=1 Tax=Quillaja saponaria TaxID=32244 RepID=A0AAD7KPC0_QUISA|nr:E3 ubiquitin-protein ligase RHA2A [Quillaja saponaria]